MFSSASKTSPVGRFSWPSPLPDSPKQDRNSPSLSNAEIRSSASSEMYKFSLASAMIDTGHWSLPSSSPTSPKFPRSSSSNEYFRTCAKPSWRPRMYIRPSAPSARSTGKLVIRRMPSDLRYGNPARSNPYGRPIRVSPRVRARCASPSGLSEANRAYATLNGCNCSYWPPTMSTASTLIHCSSSVA